MSLHQHQLSVLSVFINWRMLLVYLLKQIIMLIFLKPRNLTTIACNFLVIQSFFPKSFNSLLQQIIFHCTHKVTRLHSIRPYAISSIRLCAQPTTNNVQCDINMAAGPQPLRWRVHIVHYTFSCYTFANNIAHTLLYLVHSMCIFGDMFY